MMPVRSRSLPALARFALASVACLLPISLTREAAAQTPIAGFKDTAVLGNLVLPTAVRFSPDGRIFVAEKQGQVVVYPSLGVGVPQPVIDVSANTYSYADHGVLGLALDPQFPAQPFVYVLYTYNAPPGGVSPTWLNGCPTPPGPLTDGCVVTGRLSKFQVNAQNQVVGGEQVLIDAHWCQQFTTHSIGSLNFGADGALYVSGGEGANPLSVDYGQFGGTLGTPPLVPVNPCGDPPGGVGGAMNPPDARGGALRSQRLISPVASDPGIYSGSILRVDPNTGQALPTNPLYNGPRAGADAQVAFGLRQPYRFTIRPGTNELWIGDVGWDTWEEIDRVVNPIAPVLNNFGWPCYEGALVQPSYQAAGLTLCQNLYNNTNIPPYTSYVGPYFTYRHTDPVVAGDTCPPGSSAVTALAFYTGGSYPASYNGALFFGDYGRNCIWVMMPGANGLPDPNNVQAFNPGAPGPVDLQIGPGGDLFYADIQGWAVHRIQYVGGKHPPTAVISENATNGTAPFTVNFDGTGSTVTDPGDTIVSYSWDLNGDGVFGDSTAPKPSYIYPYGTYVVSLQVTDSQGLTGTAQVTINSSNTPPVATILSPSPSFTWSVAQPITFSGQGTDNEDGILPASAMSWQVILHHCPSNCHDHYLQTYTGVTGATFDAPDHSYPAYLEVLLTVTDSGHATNTASLNLYPLTTTLTFNTTPAGLTIAVGAVSQPAPYAPQVIVGSTQTVSAPSPQIGGSTGWLFSSWSDGGAENHQLVAPASPTSYVASFNQCVGAIPTVTGVTPASQEAGANVTVSGTGFGPNVAITFDGTAQPTTFVSSGQALARVPSGTVGHVFTLAAQNPQGCPSQQVVTVTLAPHTGCGLLGIEPFAALAFLRLCRRRARR